MKVGFLKYVFFVVCLTVLEARGQNDFFFNHYMFNPSYFNPAWVGSEENAFVAAHHRTQWAGYDATFDPGGVPSTQLVSLSVPFQSAYLSGFGVAVTNDLLGPLITNQVRISVAVKRETSIGLIRLGLMPSVNLISGNTDRYRFRDDGDDVVNELLNNGLNEVLPNLHAGLMYSNYNSLDIGISVENIIEPRYNLGSPLDNVLERNYNVFARKSMGITRDLEFIPSILIRTDLNSYSMDVSGVLEYEQRLWGGLAFRRAESLSVLVGYSFLENGKLKAGYSFDYIIRDRDAKEPTSHEIFIRYNLPDLVFGGRKAVKTPRFAF